MNDDPERPRGSVRAHLRKLMAATAVVGLAAATSRAGAASPAPAGTASAAPPDAGAPGDASVEADAAPTCPPDSEVLADGRCAPIAYGVVDPMPPPSRGGCGCHKDPGVAEAYRGGKTE